MFILVLIISPEARPERSPSCSTNHEVSQCTCWESGACTAFTVRENVFTVLSFFLSVVYPSCECAGRPRWMLELGHQSLFSSVSTSLLQTLLALVSWVHTLYNPFHLNVGRLVSVIGRGQGTTLERTTEADGNHAGPRWQSYFRCRKKGK